MIDKRETIVGCVSLCVYERTPTMKLQTTKQLPKSYSWDFQLEVIARTVFLICFLLRILSDFLRILSGFLRILSDFLRILIDF